MRLINFIGAAIGIIFAFCYGFWTMVITGSGHVNLVWFVIFIFVEFFGIYFPIMGALIPELDSRRIQKIFASLISFNVIGSIIILFLWSHDILGNGDYLRTDRTWIVISAPVHFLPAAVFIGILSFAIYRQRRVGDET